jgi:hypothetical protein
MIPDSISPLTRQQSVTGTTPYSGRGTSCNDPACQNLPGEITTSPNVTDYLQKESPAGETIPSRQEILRQISPTAETIVKPEMKEPTLKIIGDIHSIQEKGGGSIPLEKVIETFGVKLTPEQEQMLTKRGEIQFATTGAQGGTFVNKGEVLKFSANGLDIKIPKEVSGKYDSTSQDMSFHFAEGKRISAGKLFVSFDLENLSANQKHIAVDMEGKDHDQYIVFDPKHRR